MIQKVVINTEAENLEEKRAINHKINRQFKYRIKLTL